MAGDLTREAAEMLLGGATLVAEPCPYCGGVRVMKGGQAMCAGCGRRPAGRGPAGGAGSAKSALEGALEEKLESLSGDLRREADPQRQREILESINSVLGTLERTRDRRVI